MPTVHFHLKDKNSKSPTLISLYYTVNRKRFVISTGEKVHPYFWNPKNERVKGSHPEKERINKKLDRLAYSTREIEDKLIREKGSASAKDVKEGLKIVLGKKQNRGTLFDYIPALIADRETNNRFREGTIKNYRSMWKQLQSFAKAEKVEYFDFTDITYQWWKEFTAYLFDQDLSNNYVNKILSNLRAFLNEATREGVNKFLEYKNFGTGVDTNPVDTIYVNSAELEKFYRFEFKHSRHTKARDLFLLGAYTGLRHSDFSRLDLGKHLKEIDGYPIISIITEKKNTPVLIPLHPIVESTLKKYGGKAPDLAQQNMNDYIKEAGKVSGLFDKKEAVRTYKGGKQKTEYKARWELLSTHTCRRSFATNAFLQGWPTLSIMKITDHKTETSFMKYIRVSKEQNAVHIAKTQFHQIEPEGVKMRDALELLREHANTLELTAEEAALLDRIRQKIKTTLPASYLRIAK